MDRHLKVFVSSLQLEDNTSQPVVENHFRQQITGKTRNVTPVTSVKGGQAPKGGWCYLLKRYFKKIYCIGDLL